MKDKDDTNTWIEQFKKEYLEEKRIYPLSASRVLGLSKKYLEKGMPINELLDVLSELKTSDYFINKDLDTKKYNWEYNEIYKPGHDANDYEHGITGLAKQYGHKYISNNKDYRESCESMDLFYKKMGLVRLFNKNENTKSSNDTYTNNFSHEIKNNSMKLSGKYKLSDGSYTDDFIDKALDDCKEYTGNTKSSNDTYTNSFSYEIENNSKKSSKKYQLSDGSYTDDFFVKIHDDMNPKILQESNPSPEEKVKIKTMITYLEKRIDSLSFDLEMNQPSKKHPSFENSKKGDQDAISYGQSLRAQEIKHTNIKLNLNASKDRLNELYKLLNSNSNSNDNIGIKSSNLGLFKFDEKKDEKKKEAEEEFFKNLDLN